MTDDHLERGNAWRQRATTRLQALSRSRAVPAGSKPPRGEVLYVDQRRVELAAQCPARPPDDGDEYVESTAKARRRVGLAVLRAMQEQPRLDPLSAFELVLAQRDERLPDRLLPWLDALGPGGQSALAQEAMGYAASVAAWVPPARMGKVAVLRPSDVFRWDVPDRALRIAGRCEAITPIGGRPPGRRLLLVVNGLDGAELRAGHLALAYALNMASVPEAVTVLAPATGKLSIPVDEALLEAALARVEVVVRTAEEGQEGGSSTTCAGAWCRRCPAVAACPAGGRWVAEHPVRIGGLLLPAA